MASHAHAQLDAPAADNAEAVRCALAFDRVYQDHFDFVWRSMRRLGVPEAHLDDAVQEAFLVVHRHLPGLEIRVSFKAWLSGVVTRVASEARRSLRRKDPRVRGGDAGADVEQLEDTRQANPQDELERADALRVLYELLEELEWQKREIFVLVELEQLSIPEAADAVGVNENTVYSRIRAARQAFDQAVARRLAREKWRDRCPA